MTPYALYFFSNWKYRFWVGVQFPLGRASHIRDVPANKTDSMALLLFFRCCLFAFILSNVVPSAPYIQADLRRATHEKAVALIHSKLCFCFVSFLAFNFSLKFEELTGANFRAVF